MRGGPLPRWLPTGRTLRLGRCTDQSCHDSSEPAASACQIRSLEIWLILYTHTHPPAPRPLAPCRSFEFINGGAPLIEGGPAVPGSIWLNSFTGTRAPGPAPAHACARAP